VIIADIWQWTPFIFILSLAALQSLPRSALEAAKIDGATGWQQIRYIKLPLMMPVLIVTGLLRLIDAFKVLEVILVMTEGGPGLQRYSVRQKSSLKKCRGQFDRCQI
jgi:multiple sugar transport system permease protein